MAASGLVALGLRRFAELKDHFNNFAVGLNPFPALFRGHVCVISWLVASSTVFCHYNRERSRPASSSGGSCRPSRRRELQENMVVTRATTDNSGQ